MTRVIFEPGDVLPSLIAMRPGQLNPGDVVWGVQDRKGFVIDAEPKGTIAAVGTNHGMFTGVPIREGGTLMFKTDALVLIEVET